MRHRLTVIAVTLCHSHSSRGCRRGGWLSRKRIQLINGGGGGQTEWLKPATLLANLNKTICTANSRKLCLFANILLKWPFHSTGFPSPLFHRPHSSWTDFTAITRTQLEVSGWTMSGVIIIRCYPIPPPSQSPWSSVSHCQWVVAMRRRRRIVSG